MSGDQLDLDAIEARAEDFPRYGLTGGDRQLIDEDVPALVAEVRRLRALSDRLREQLQHECPHGEMSWSGVDRTPLDDPDKQWACDNCGKVLAADDRARTAEHPALAAALTRLRDKVLDPVQVTLEGPLVGRLKVAGWINKEIDRP